jgi:putative thioredoxin
VKSEAQTARATAVLLDRTADGSGDEVDEMLLAGQRTDAFDTLIGQLQGAVTGGRTDERDALRDRLLDLFSLYDPADPTVIDARTRMASALF